MHVGLRLQILIYTFRRWFNSSNMLLNQLNNYSYNVYIIHMIVLGIVALILVDVSIPIFVKYLALTKFAFIASNFIVYAYSLAGTYLSKNRVEPIP